MNIVEIPRFLLVGEPTSLKITDGAWVAGGAIRCWYLQKPNKSDIDFFFNSEQAAEVFKQANNISNPKYTHKNADTFDTNGKVIQLIKIYHENIESIFDSFDFTICQFAYDGKTVYATAEAMITAARGHLTVHKIQQGYELDSLRRAFKYAKKGFEPCLGCLKQIGESFRNISEESLQNQLEISPNGGKRIVRLD